MTGLLYVYCNNAENRRQTGQGRDPNPRRRGLVARARRLLRTTLAWGFPASHR